MIDLSDQLLLGKPFEGELDPNRCDFGKWYYAFKSDDPEMMKMHAAIEEPHSKLHHSAYKIKRLYEAGEIEKAISSSILDSNSLIASSVSST